MFSQIIAHKLEHETKGVLGSSIQSDEGHEASVAVVEVVARQRFSVQSLSMTFSEKYVSLTLVTHQVYGQTAR